MSTAEKLGAKERAWWNESMGDFSSWTSFDIYTWIDVGDAMLPWIPKATANERFPGLTFSLIRLSSCSCGSLGSSFGSSSEDIPDVQWLTCSIRSSSVFAVCLASASWRGPRLVWQHSASIQWGSLCFGVCVRKSHVHWIGQDVGNRLRKHEHPQNQRNYICLSQSLEANISPSSTCTWPSWPWYTMRIWIWFEHSIPAVLVHYHNPLKLPYWDTPDFWTHTHTHIGCSLHVQANKLSSKAATVVSNYAQVAQQALRWITIHFCWYWGRQKNIVRFTTCVTPICAKLNGQNDAQC